MRKTILKISIILFWFSASSFSQDFSSLWQAHYSYNNIVDVVSGENKIYAAAQNAVFEYDTSTNEITTITTIDGLSGEQITTIYYSEIYQYLVIGYETGLIELYSETEREVLTVVDILEKQNITPVNKRINHFYENEGLVYISTDYGVSIYDLERLEFGDTYFLGDGGSQITVKQVSILNNEIYVACLNNNGVKKADLTNPNLIDFGQWQTIITGNYQTMNTINNKIYAVRSNNVIYEIDGVSINTPITLPLSPLDADVSGSNLIYSTTNAIYVYNENIQLVNTFQPNTDFDTDFTSAITLNESIYIGTQSLGVLSNSVSNTEIYTEILPNGPLFNETFRLNAETNVVWTSFGDYTIDLDPSPLRSRGLSYFRNDVWESIPYDDVFGAKNLSQISINPFMSNQVFRQAFFRFQNTS